MFNRFFACAPQKLMQNYLREASPDPALWPEVCAYLTKGRRAKTRPAKVVLSAYLGLRESLGGQAAFRAAGELKYDSLCDPCRDFACSYIPPSGMDGERAMDWARFLLAADHLLALAYEESLSPGVSRSEQAARMQALFEKTKDEYLTPLKQENQTKAKNSARQTRTPASAKAAAA
jgi:hypothetical protein